MRWLLGFWFTPISILAGWLLLASHDLSFGVQFLSRDFYDLVFQVYSNALGIPAEVLPPMVVRALILDSGVVLALYAFRRRRQIIAFCRHLHVRWTSSAALPRADSLSNAP